MNIRPSTAPRILYDLLQYTPPHIKKFRQVVESNCHHVYATCADRSIIPELDERPEAGKAWEVEALCQRCHTHLTLRIDFADSTSACPCHDFPLHQFMLQQEAVTDSDRAHSFEFLCKSPVCNAKLSAQIRAPALTQYDHWVLTDPVGLKQRWKNCQDRGVPEPNTPIQALSTFRSYIRDAITSETSKSIPTYNKRFMLALGGDAAVLLTGLGFVFEEPADNQPFGRWRLPGPGPFLDGEARTLLQDVYDELLSLMQQRPDEEKQRASEPLYTPPPSTKDMERALGCQKCKYSAMSNMHRFCAPRSRPIWFQSPQPYPYFSFRLAQPAERVMYTRRQLERKLSCGGDLSIID